MLIQQASKKAEALKLEFASKMKGENGVNPEYYALIKVSDLEEVESLPDDYFMIEGLDKVSE